MDKAGTIFFMENASSFDKMRLHKLTKERVLTTIAGGVLDKNIDGIGEKAGFQYVSGMTVDAQGNKLISTGEGVRKVSKK
jgi:membrane-bound ClpP family serine protease